MLSEYYGKAGSELCSWMLRTKALEPKYLVPGRCYPFGCFNSSTNYRVLSITYLFHQMGYLKETFLEL